MEHANALTPPPNVPVRVTLLVLPETSMLTVAATLDPMRAANRFARQTLFSWSLVSGDGEPVPLTCGLSLPAQFALANSPPSDLLIVLAGFNHAQHASPALIRLLHRIARQRAAIMAAESGAWVLARAGLLDGHRATTHWEDLDDFAQAFPEIDVSPERFVLSGDRLTAGGASPVLDLMLHLIRSYFGASLALQVASAFIYDDIHAGSDPQKQLSPGRLATTEPDLDRALLMMAQTVEEPLGIAEIARRAGVSRRSLEILFRKRLGTSPAAYSLDLRLQAAARMASDTALDFQSISVRTGFASQQVFTRAFRRSFGASPGQYRRARTTLSRSDVQTGTSIA